MLLVVLSAFSGALLLLILEIFAFKLWVKKQRFQRPVSNVPDSTGLPAEHLAQLITGEGEGGAETACFINKVMSFLFQELKDAKSVRAKLLEKLNQEIAEILTGKLQSRVIKYLRIHDFSVGTAPPIINNLSIVKLRVNKDTNTIEKLHIRADVTYTGCGRLALQAGPTMFGKSAYLSVEVSKLEGQIEILLKRRPTTHWGFCFTAEPVLQLNVVSALENRSLPHLTSLVSSAIKRIIRKKHTKPNYTKRYGPLFPRPEPTLGKTELLLQSSPLSVGKLLVRVVSANRAAIINQDPLYCTVSIGEKAWDPHCCPLSQNISFDTQLNNIESTGMGIVFEQDKPEESTVEGLIIDNVGKNSPASKESLKPGDIVTAIENKRISNIGSALAASFTCSDSARLTIKRPSVQYKRTGQYSGDVSQDMAQYQEQLEIQQLERTAVEEDDEYLVVLGKFLECSTELIDPPPSRSRSGSTASTRDPHSSCDKDPTVEECRNSEERVMCTKLAPASITLHWDQYFSYNVEEHHKYISVCLWRECSDKPVLVGYANISLTDVVLQCVSTASNTHHESVILVPTPNVKWQESGPLQQPVPSLPPLLPKMKLIAGEVKLQFTHSPPDYDSALCQEHTFVLSQFQARMRCAQCMRTNVHHTAYICLVCSVTVHQNCLQHYTKMNTEPADPPQVTKSLRSRTFSQKKRRSFVARSQSTVFRQTISSTVEEPKLVNNDKITLPSFFFLKGTEKKMAVLKEKLAEVDHDIKMKFVQRKDLLVTKQQCHSDHTPVEVDQGISSCEEFIKNLLSQKAELQTRLKAQKERLPNSVPTSSEE